MKILILETSTEKACLVLAENEHVLNSQPLDGGPQLSKTLAIQVKFILSGIVPDLIAVGTGPGSYTGIRVGAALAQGLSFGWNIPLLGFCSLHGYNSEITPIIDARSAGFYILFDGKPTLVSSTDPRLLHTALASPAPLPAEFLQDHPRVPWAFARPGFHTGL